VHGRTVRLQFPHRTTEVLREDGDRMRFVEARDLDGPNLFALEPVIKLELALAEGDTTAALQRELARLHELIDEPLPWVRERALDLPGRVALSYPWRWRDFALAVARAAYDGVAGNGAPEAAAELADLRARDQTAQDSPLWVRDTERRVPAVGITGTNGKTTTTRLLAHIARTAGRSVGWSSSSGVYINGELVLEGDYTGPSGARRVLEDPSVELAVLETARGGILLRGVAYESNDVGVFLNVSADHLSLQGVETLTTLAEVKSTVVRVTRPEGLVVLNADDPLVLAQRDHVQAEVVLITQRPDAPVVAGHRRGGGRVIARRGGEIVALRRRRARRVIALDDVPLAFGGAAPHMVENVLAATAAAVGVGLPLDEIAEGLRTFRPDPYSNAGRLNVFDVDDRAVIIDYAHNEAGLQHLIDFCRALMSPQGRLITVIGTAGDRQDDVLRGLGWLAGRRADLVFLKDNPTYRRGRAPGAVNEIMRAGIEDAAALDRLGGSLSCEYDATLAALEVSQPGDYIVVMCQEDHARIVAELDRRGARAR
jgi:cyanophycin synthetase